MKDTCETCRFLFDPRIPANRWDVRRGDCRRYPPMMSPAGLVTNWFPRVPLEGWCGEYQRREAE